LILQYAYYLPVRRATNDIDFGIVIESWDEFANLRDALVTGEGFRPHPHQQQRLLHEEGAIIDLVPFGNLEQATGLIVWPPDFAIEMSTVGFREASASLNNKDSIELRNERAQVALTILRLGLGSLFVSVFFENLGKGLYSPSGYSGLINYYIEIVILEYRFGRVSIAF